MKKTCPYSWRLSGPLDDCISLKTHQVDESTSTSFFHCRPVGRWSLGLGAARQASLPDVRARLRVLSNSEQSKFSRRDSESGAPADRRADAGGRRDVEDGGAPGSGTRERRHDARCRRRRCAGCYRSAGSTRHDRDSEETQPASTSPSLPSARVWASEERRRVGRLGTTPGIGIPGVHYSASWASRRAAG
jgi:hypothetical protein